MLMGAEQGSTDNTDSGTTLDLTLPVLNMFIVIFNLNKEQSSLLLDTPAQPPVTLERLIVAELRAVKGHILPGIHLHHGVGVRQYLSVKCLKVIFLKKF